MEIPIHGGQFAIIDEQILPLISQYKWYLYNTTDKISYAQGYHPETKARVLMHRIIMNVSKDSYVDHKNKNGLDNRQCNLRVCTSGQNNANRRPSKNGTSKYLGVSWSKLRKKWHAQITKNKRTILVGAFDNEVDAAIAYNKVAIEFHGEFANLNVIL